MLASNGCERLSFSLGSTLNAIESTANYSSNGSLLCPVTPTRKMKFYIASRVKNKDLVSKLHTKLIKLGHEILSTWIDEKDIIPYEKHTGESAKRAS